MINFIVPVLFISVGWFLYEPVSFFASSVLFLYTIIMLLVDKKKLFRFNLLLFLALSLPFTYIISGIFNSQSIYNLINGSNGRNLGVSSLISLSLILIYMSRTKLDIQKFITYNLGITLILANLYGYLQYFNLDPIKWVNPNNAVTLTLGNPNFAGALFGCLTIYSLHSFLSTYNLAMRIGLVGFGLSSIFLSFKTNSLQSPLLILLSIFLYVIILSLNDLSKKLRLLKYSSITLVLSLIFTIGFLVKFSLSFRNRIFSEGSISPRIDYWRTGLEIWQDNKLLGVGADEFQRFAAIYRTPSQVVRDSNFIIPDKAHNVFIDHLANGGFIAALLWLSLVLYTIRCLTYLIYKSSMNRKQLAFFGSVYLSYIAQTMISPDQIILATIGTVISGAIIGMYFLHQGSEVKTQSAVKPNHPATKFALALLAIIMSLYYSAGIKAQYQAKQILDGEIVGKDSYVNVINSWPNVKFTEEMAIESLREPDNCDFSIIAANRLLELDNRNSQGWFIKAACANIDRKFDLAVKYVDNSIKFDPLNVYYIVSKAKLLISANRLDEAELTLSKAKSINPSEPDIGSVEESLRILTNQSS